MRTVVPFVKRHPVLTYYVLTFAISWGGALLAIGGPDGIPATREEFDRLLPLAIPSLLGGPTVAGLLMTGVVDGKAGFRKLLSRLLRWRVGLRWYAVALLTSPLVFAAVHLALLPIFPALTPGILTTSDRGSLLLGGFTAAIMVSVFEETGWTGFAIPRMRLRHGIFATGLIAGLLWGAWHLLMNILWASDVSRGDLSPALYVTMGGLLMVIGGLPAVRVLIVWLYDQTESLLLAMLVHVSYAACTFIIGAEALAISGTPLLVYSLAMAAALWAVVGVGAIVIRRQPSRQQLQRQAA